VGCFSEAAQRAVAELEAAGLIHVDRRGRGRSNHYRVFLQGAPETETPSAPETETPERHKRTGNRNSGVPKTETQAHRKPKPNYTHELYPLNETSGAVQRRKWVTPDVWELAQAAMTGDTLCTDAFRDAWARWVRYRRELRKPLRPSTIQAQIRTLETFGHDGAVAAIEQSIVNGWQGLFAPRVAAMPAATAAQSWRELVREAMKGIEDDKLRV